MCRYGPAAVMLVVVVVMIPPEENKDIEHGRTVL